MSNQLTHPPQPQRIQLQHNMHSILNKKITWLILWVAANAIGFSLGELIGGRTGLFGLINSKVGINTGWWWVLGCLPYGLMFGLCERLLMQPSPLGQPRPTAGQFWAWPIACAVGYALGIGAGEKLTFGIAPSPTFFGPLFGIYVGLSLGIIQAIVLRPHCAHSWRWVPACVLVWVVGEWTAFVLGFQFHNTPIVGAVIGAVSGMLMQWLCPRVTLLHAPS